MSVALGFSLDTRVLTPDGTRPLGDLAVGDLVLTVDVDGGGHGAVPILAVHEGTADQLVALEVAEGEPLRALTPGTAVWDGFEESFRGAGSLSTLSELLRAEDGVTHAIVEVPERAGGGAPIRLLTVDGPHGTFVADGWVVRHKAVR